MADEAAVTIVMGMRDDASADLQRFDQNVQTSKKGLQGYETQLSQTAQGLISFGNAALGSISLLMQFSTESDNASEASKRQRESLIKMLTMGQIFLSLASTVMSLTNALKGSAIAAAVLQAIMGNPWAAVIGLVAGAAVAIGMYKLLSYQSGGTVPGPIGTPRLAMVHGGETITPPGQGGGGIHIHVGAMLGRDADAREFARLISKYTREEQRLGGF